jgi:mannose-1-phosphate guanylyltransferase/mannose-1-phosphate guanylyltransferase/mannose-6-phosphate isomerase
MTAKVIPVVLSGGSGTRLWPLSRTLYPKQLLPLAERESMLVATARRASAPDLFAAPLVVCGDEHRFIVAEQLRQAGITPSRIVLEPKGRNTAPAAAVAALLASADNPDATLLILPSDHVVSDTAAFLKAVRSGLAAIACGRLVTFGITPTRPETGYGYIRAGAALAEAPGCLALDRFVEKPDRATAEQWLKQGGYVWNSGMFLFSARQFVAELEQAAPQMLAACRSAVAAARSDLDFLRLPPSFAECPAAPIDTAVMERTKAGAVAPAEMGWSDVGSWQALWEIGSPDADGNVVVGDAVLHQARNCYVRSDARQITAVAGVENLVVVATDDAILVVPRERAQDVKNLVDLLKARGRSEADMHRVVYRPWGSYQSVDMGERFQVKRITVNPGHKLSSQMHHHRAEHWVVVQGTARVSCDKETRLLHENESIYIPLGAVHRLENPGKVPLHLIEVQSGGYLGEDDIVRFSDDYGRS